MIPALVLVLVGVGGAGCSSILEWTAPECGDGRLDDGEECDTILRGATCQDFGFVGGDLSCDASCLLDTSACISRCGDGFIGPDEGCDDGNLTNDDGCSSLCTAEPGWACAGIPSQCSTVCGDGTRTPDEVCDDGNNAAGDGCSADCSSDESCGNGVIDTAAGEACDDGNFIESDGCGSTCAVTDLVANVGAATHEDPQVAIAGDGRFVVAWRTTTTAGPHEVNIRRYGTDGIPVNAAPERISDDTTASAYSPAIDMARDGRFVVAWRSNAYDTNLGIVGKSFDVNHVAVGTDYPISGTTTANQWTVDVAVLGTLVTVAWTDGGNGNISDYLEFGVAEVPNRLERSIAASEHVGRVTVSAGGAAPGTNVVMTWQASGGGIWFSRNYSATLQQANPASQTLVSVPAVAVGTDGSFVIVWLVQGAAETVDLFARRFDATGTPVGSEFQVNTYKDAAEFPLRSPAVSMDDRGNFVVVWASRGNDGDAFGIAGRLYDDQDAPLTDELILNTFVTGNQWLPDVDMAPDGRFVAVWESDFIDGGDSGIAVQRYDALGNAVGSLPW